MMLSNLLLVGLSVCQVQAEAHPVAVSLEAIRFSSRRLSMAVVKWDGFPLSAFPILLKSAATQKATKQAIYSTIQSEPFDLFEALEVGTVAKYLVQDVESLLHYMGATQPKFKKALLASLVYGQIKTQEKVCEDLFYEVVKKLPSMAKGEGEKLQRRVALAFMTTKRKFKPDEPETPLDAGEEEADNSDFGKEADDSDFGESITDEDMMAAVEKIGLDKEADAQNDEANQP